MKKIILCLSALFFLLSGVCFASNALIEELDLLTEDEKAGLESYLEEKSDALSADIAVILKDNTGGDFDAFEEEITNNGGYRDDAVIFVLSLDDGLYDVILKGSADREEYEEGCSALAGVFVSEYLGGGRAAEGIKLFADEWAKALSGDPDSVILSGDTEKYGSTEEPVVFPDALNGQTVIDAADLLTDEEEASLALYADEISEKQGTKIVVLTVDTIGSEYPKYYADTYYDTHGYGEEGVLLLISIGTRDWYISTSGERTRAVIDSKYEAIGEHMIDAGLSAGDYYAAFTRYVKDIDSYFNYKKYISPGGAAIALIIGLASGLITTGILKSRLKSVSQKTEANAYVDQKSIKIKEQKDVFLYASVSKTARQSSSGGGSGGGGGGGSHGGGGGKF